MISRMDKEKKSGLMIALMKETSLKVRNTVKEFLSSQIREPMKELFKMEQYMGTVFLNLKMARHTEVIGSIIEWKEKGS